MQPPAPLPEHKVFEKDVGTWDASVVVYPGPDAEPQRSRGTMVSHLVCGGRWLVSDFKNETSGFEGHGMYTFDPVKQKYTGVWADSMRSSIIVAEGTWDPTTKTMTMTSELDQNGRKIRWREVTELVDADTQIFRSFIAMPNGGELEMMTVTYTRKR